jgi:predicted ribosome quality control (RQC) complex YloA/Tae2 family protein
MPSPFNYALMELLCKELQERVTNFKVVDCLPHDRLRFFLILQKQKHQEALFFCFTPPFLRFHLTQRSLPHEHSTHPLLSLLQDAIFQNACLLQKDRILQITFQTPHGERLFIAEFFSKHPNYYVIQSDGQILFALHSLHRSHYQLPTPPSSVSLQSPIWFSHQEVEDAYAKMEKQWEFTHEKHACHAQLNKQLKKLQRKEKELLENLNQCGQWRKVQHEGELIKFHFTSIKKGISSLTLQDWESDHPYHLKLDPAKSPQEEMASRFRRAKKLQAGIVPLTQYLERTRKELHHIEQLQHKLETFQNLEELISFKSKLSLPSSKPKQGKAAAISLASIYREFESAKGLKIWVGKNAKTNEQLTFQLANGRDWWLHANGCSGSHVIIRVAKDLEPDSETLKDALQLALYYSKMRGQGEGEICYTQRKYVSRFGKGRAGLVQISKHQIAWIKFDPARFHALQERLKENL